MFNSVFRIWNTEAKLKVKTLEASLTEVMSLYHAEFLHRLVTHGKFNTEKDTHITHNRPFNTLAISIIQIKHLTHTHVAPTVLSFKNCGVNW
jgi:hypothetical protein